MSRILLEICCGSADDVIQAEKGGADRVELNSNLFQGGLTPSIGTLEVVKRCVSIPVMTMVRPRAGGFCYTDVEFETAKADARALLRGGADGLVFGFLHEDGTVDEERTAEMVSMCEGRPSVFHRALDVTPNWKRALDSLIRLGVTRVLTSGQAEKAFYAQDTLAEMIRFADGAIEILPGAGIRLENVKSIVRTTGCTQVHLSRHKSETDSSVANNRGIHFGNAQSASEDCYEVTDCAYVAAMRRYIDSEV